MDYAKMVADFAEKHPVWTWILARFVIAVSCCIIVFVGFFALVMFAAPFVRIEEQGMSAFGWWLWLPLPVTVIWLLCSLIGTVWEAFISEW